MSSITVDGWPANAAYLVLLGVTWCTSSARNRSKQVRNQRTYQAGTWRPSVSTTFALYQALAQTLKQEDELVQQYKIQLNMENGYGSVGLATVR